MSEVSSVNPSDSASNVHSISARPDNKVMEAVKEGQDTSQRHGPQRIDVMSCISGAIVDECLTNNMSVIEPALTLLEARGVQACCTTAWTCVCLRWFDRFLVEKIKQLDPGATLETQVNGRSLKPQMSWYQLNGVTNDLEKLYKDMREAHEGCGLYVQAEDISYYDQAVCADLLCYEPALIFRMTLEAAERPVRPWSNCVRMSAFFNKIPTLCFGTFGFFQGDPKDIRPYEDWLQSNKEKILSANEYKSSILRIANILQMPKQCTMGFLLASVLIGGQGLRDHMGCELIAPLTGSCVGGDIMLPKPSFTSPLAYLFTTRATSSMPQMPEVVSQFYEHLDRIAAAMVTWNCGLYIASQTWHLTQEIHPYGFHLARGAVAPTLHTRIARAYLNTYECYRNGDDGRGWEEPSGMPHVTRVLFGYLHLITGLDVPVFVQCRIKLLSALDSQFGVRFRELIEREEIDLTKWIMRFVPLQSIYGLCLSVPTVWPGVMRNDYVELIQYQEADRDEPTEEWFTNIRSAINAP